MSLYYFGGYYLVQLKPIDFGSSISQTVYTCSNCINNSLVDNWSYSWVNDNNNGIKDVYHKFEIDSLKLLAIRNWVDEKFDANRVGWVDVFADLETAESYKQTFFSHLNDIVIMSIYLSENERNDLLDEFKPQKEGQGSIGLYQNLIKGIIEDESKNEEFIGFDLIGVEYSGDFHTFYCHDISNDLINKFGLEINSYGLLNDSDNWESILNHMNDEKTGLEPVPWFSAKIKLVSN